MIYFKIRIYPPKADIAERPDGLIHHRCYAPLNVIISVVPMRGRIGGNVRQFAYSEHLDHKQAMADFKARRASQATSWTN